MCKYVGRGVYSKCACRGQTTTFRQQCSGVNSPSAQWVSGSNPGQQAQQQASLTADPPYRFFFPRPFVLFLCLFCDPMDFTQATHKVMGVKLPTRIWVTNWSVASSMKTILSFAALALDYHLLLWVGWGYCEPLSTSDCMFTAQSHVGPL